MILEHKVAMLLSAAHKAKEALESLWSAPSSLRSPVINGLSARHRDQLEQALRALEEALK